ncbi:MAG: hypothetical protein ABW194_06795, partial [Novosphingobium sp.]
LADADHLVGGIEDRRLAAVGLGIGDIGHRVGAPFRSWANERRPSPTREASEWRNTYPVETDCPAVKPSLASIVHAGRTRGGKYRKFRRKGLAIRRRYACSAAAKETRVPMRLRVAAG